MNKKHIVISIFGFIISFLTDAIFADGRWVLSEQQYIDKLVMYHLINMTPETNNNKSDIAKTDFGPEEYRIATKQERLFKTTYKPWIYRENPGDNLSNEPGPIPVQPNEFPWQVALTTPDGTPFCGGSHIGNGWIVTAAHCFTDRNNESLTIDKFSVLSGTVNLLDDNASQNSASENYILHDLYDPISYVNDIALVHVKEIKNLQTVKIPDENLEKQVISQNPNLVISGWGRETRIGSLSTELLKKAGVPVLDVKQCKDAFPQIDVNSTLCAGVKGRSTCEGDSGGPVTGKFSGNSAVLLGVISKTRACGKGVPEAFTRLVYYRDWISRITKINL